MNLTSQNLELVFYSDWRAVSARMKLRLMEGVIAAMRGVADFALADTACSAFAVSRVLMLHLGISVIGQSVIEALRELYLLGFTYILNGVLATHSCISNQSSTHRFGSIIRRGQSQFCIFSFCTSAMQDTVHPADSPCPGNNVDCHSHFHDEDPKYLAAEDRMHVEHDIEEGLRNTSSPEARMVQTPKAEQDNAQLSCKEGLGFRGVIRNFTPSYVELLYQHVISNRS
jgi:hypothetical protein